MTHNNQNITDYHAGDALDVVVTVTADDVGTDPADLIANASEIEWLLKNDPTDEDGAALVTKSLVDGIDTNATDASLATDEFAVHLATGDTTGLGGQSLHHRARITDAEGNRSTVFTGEITIEH